MFISKIKSKIELRIIKKKKNINNKINKGDEISKVNIIEKNKIK
jgi:hypothetical protein